MKHLSPSGFIILGFLLAVFVFIDLVFRFFFIHSPWAEEHYALVGAWFLLVTCLVVLARTSVKLRRTEADLRQAGEELQRRVDERTAQLKQAHQQLLAETSERQRIEERQRLARELHDSVAQSLYGIALGINTASSFLDADRTRTEEALEYALGLTNAGLVEMRSLIFELRPDNLEAQGLVVALTKRVAALRAHYTIDVELDLCDEPDISPGAKEALCRIAQEALRNVVRHARASRLDLRLFCEPEWLTLEVCDNGAGFDPMIARPGHLGLESMRERAEGVGGTLEIVSAAGCGTQIRARVPLTPVARNESRKDYANG